MADCSLPLQAMTLVTSFMFEGLWVRGYEAETETRRVESDYVVGEAGGTMEMEGTVTLSNKRDRSARISYQQRWDVPADVRAVFEGGPACFEWSESRIVYEISEVVDPGGSVELDISWLCRLHPLSDINADGRVDGVDQGLLFADWGKVDSQSDLNRDGKVDGRDLGILQARWGWEAPWNQQP